MDSEMENFGFYIYRVDGNGRTRVSDEPTQGTARIYGRTYTDTEYKFFDKKGSPGAMYQVETLPLKSSPLASTFVQTKYVADLSTLGLGGKDFLLPKATSGNVVSKDVVLDSDLKDEVTTGLKAADLNNQRLCCSATWCEDRSE